ncbi:VOC family protein [Singulisphaera sp. PoT]|uniref:VOC family protein n=1 Tax=Singulisphaera sp. PoT TaxID=3411797 RepID=UPI003BF476CC
MSQAPKPGTIGWIDLTVPNAEEVRDFYKAVVGWTASEIDMGGYSDFCMHPATGDEGEAPVSGICHARGTNASLPPAWLVYITVEDLDASARLCQELGGKILLGPRDSGGAGRYCVIEDPAGAVAALFCPAPPPAS